MSIFDIYRATAPGAFLDAVGGTRERNRRYGDRSVKTDAFSWSENLRRADRVSRATAMEEPDRPTGQWSGLSTSGWGRGVAYAAILILAGAVLVI